MMCLSCVDKIDEEDGPVGVLFLYSIPGEPEQTVIAYLCQRCGADTEVENTYYAMEAMINARLARLRNPEKSWYPKA